MGDIRVNYEFVIITEPDEDTIKEFHKRFARDLIDNYGVATMREVVAKFKEAKEK